MKYLIFLFSFLTFGQEVYHCTFEEPLTQRSVTSDFNVTPTVVTGGTDTHVTITGLGFGEVKGILKWGGTPQSAYWQIPSWTDTEIIAIVPPHARSGNITVLTLDQTVLGTTNPITVMYNIYNKAGAVGDSYEWFKTVHVGEDDGVMYFHVPEGTPQSFRNTFSNALQAWKDAVDINWALSNEDVPSGTTYGDDGISVASIGESAGLASAISYFSDCGGNKWYRTNGDVTFDESQSYTTMLHELGHVLGLGHNTSGQSSIMYFTGGSGIGAIDIEAGFIVKDWNCIGVSCQTNMHIAGCKLSTDDPTYGVPIKEIKYFNVLGQEVKLDKGFYIKETTYENGIIIRKKIVI